MKKLETETLICWPGGSFSGRTNSDVFWKMGVRHIARERKNSSASGSDKQISCVSFRYRKCHLLLYYQSKVIVDNDEWNLLKLVLCELMNNQLNSQCFPSLSNSFLLKHIYSIILCILWKSKNENIGPLLSENLEIASRIKNLKKN